jgi:hypothetical protein
VRSIRRLIRAVDASGRSCIHQRSGAFKLQRGYRHKSDISPSAFLFRIANFLILSPRLQFFLEANVPSSLLLTCTQHSSPPNLNSCPSNSPTMPRREGHLALSLGAGLGTRRQAADEAGTATFPARAAGPQAHTSTHKAVARHAPLYRVRREARLGGDRVSALVPRLSQSQFLGRMEKLV